MYRTDKAQVNAVMPVNTLNMTAEKIFALLTKHFDTDENGIPTNKITAYAQAVSQAVFDPSDWKNPFYAVHATCGNEWVKAVIMWYHACEPRETMCGVVSNGYAG